MIRRYFPASLNVRKKSCLVIGADAEASEKALRLLESGAQVTIITHGPSAALLSAAREKGAVILERPFSTEDVADQFLVTLAIKTDPALTRLVAERCRARRVLICAIDEPDFCDFAHVSLLEKGPLQISISTDGRAPALARRIREDLDRSFSAQPVEAFVEHLSRLRDRLEREVPDLPERRKQLIAAAAGFALRVDVTFPDGWTEKGA